MDIEKIVPFVLAKLFSAPQFVSSKSPCFGTHNVKENGVEVIFRCWACWQCFYSLGCWYLLSEYTVALFMWLPFFLRLWVHSAFGVANKLTEMVCGFLS